MPTFLLNFFARSLQIDFGEFARWFKKQINATQDTVSIARSVQVRERNTPGGLPKGERINGGTTVGDGPQEEENAHHTEEAEGRDCSVEGSSSRLVTPPLWKHMEARRIEDDQHRQDRGWRGRGRFARVIALSSSWLSSKRAKKRREEEMNASSSSGGVDGKKTSRGHEIEGSAAVLHRSDSQGKTVAFLPNRGRSAAVSSYTAASPWEDHAEMLRAVAEQEAKTLLLRRAGLRARVILFGGGERVGDGAGVVVVSWSNVVVSNGWLLRPFYQGQPVSCCPPPDPPEFPLMNIIIYFFIVTTP